MAWTMAIAMDMKSGWRVYSWTLNNMGLSCAGPLICTLFSINIHLALRNPGFHILGLPQMWRADCMHCTTTFYSFIC